MLPLLFKYRRLCGLVLCVLLGLACGALAATLLGMRLSHGSLPALAGVPVGRPLPAADPGADLAFILQHNLFDPAARTRTAPAFSLQQGDGAPGGAAVQGSLQLIGTLAAGERSLAVLRAGPEVRTYRLGAALPGGGRVEEIARHQVKIRNPDLSLAILTMHEGNRSLARAAVPQSPGPASSGGVRTVGDNRWVIARAAAESARGNLGEQLRLALMQPRVIDGRTDGFIVKSITPGTLLAQMGLRQGDVIKRVNAMPIDSPEKALQILQQLREAREIIIDLERDGKPHSFAYAIE